MRSMIYFTVPLLVSRIIALLAFYRGLPPEGALLAVSWGILSDLAVGAAAGMAFRLLRHKKVLYYSAWTLWVLVFALNIEHIGINASNANFAFANLALTEDFIKGSVLTVKNLYAFAICLGFSRLLLLVLARRGVFSVRTAYLAAVNAALIFAVVLFPASKSFPYWAQMNLLEENVRGLFPGPEAYLVNAELDESVSREFFGRDLSGEPILRYPEGKPNVLVVLVEGVSNHDVFSSDSMPGFREIAGKNLSYSNFISSQHQTNRGVYSIVCGDYPNFLTNETKPDYVAMFGPLKRCLPEILSKGGYHTVFMQSANLGFMQKDMFAEKAGYDEIMGNNSYAKAILRNPWGVDDSSLYLNALEKITELNGDGKPWFITLLTSGTHHPFTVPGI
jgi:phosphoglycerol transferase MdoB-like AlkP superfamily enzyme